MYYQLKLPCQLSPTRHRVTSEVKDLPPDAGILLLCTIPRRQERSRVFALVGWGAVWATSSGSRRRRHDDAEAEGRSNGRYCFALHCLMDMQKQRSRRQTPVRLVRSRSACFSDFFFLPRQLSSRPQSLIWPLSCLLLENTRRQFILR